MQFECNPEMLSVRQHSCYLHLVSFVCSVSEYTMGFITARCSLLALSIQFFIAVLPSFNTTAVSVKQLI